MPYGLFVRNGNNETVIDENSAVLQVRRYFTISNPTTSISLPGDGTGYRFTVTKQSNSSLLFAKLAVGQAMAVEGSNVIRSNSDSPMDLMEVTLPKNLPAPSGYSLAVYNASSEIIYNANLPVVNVLNNYESPDWSNSGRPSWDITTPGEWVMMTNRGTYNYFDGAGSYSRHYSVGVKKTSTGYTHHVIPKSTNDSGGGSGGASWVGRGCSFVVAN